jgi:hypothetical protein
MCARSCVLYIEIQKAEETTLNHDFITNSITEIHHSSPVNTTGDSANTLLCYSAS